MSTALAAADKHSLVLAIDGKRLQALMKQERQDRRRENEEQKKKFEEDSKKKDKDGESKDKKDNGEASSRRSARADKDREEKDKDKEKAKDDDEDDYSEGFEALFEIIFLPYKPLYTAKLALVTGDVKKKTYSLKAAVTVEKKEDLDDAETALKSLLYTVRELAVMLPRQE